MYRTIITFKEDTPPDTLAELHRLADEAFCNRAGTATNVSTDPLQAIYEGDESKFGCLQLGILDINELSIFIPFVRNWNWIDEEEPRENHDVLQALALPVYA